jgi:SAM-dependent methyltransferase
MKLSSQQQQTLSFFDRVSSQWRMSAEGKLPNVNVIAQRNACVHRFQEATPGVRSMLDLGCGTGELVLEMAAKGVRATGIDFSPEMIRACEQKREAVGAVSARFFCRSVFAYDVDNESEDLISALGLIEYVSPKELVDLVSFSHRVLGGGGSLVLGSRNRIFNLFSLNQYTKIEMSLGTVDRLMAEAIALAGTADARALLAANSERLPQPSTHPITGIGVDVRYQYTPNELATIVREGGFSPAALYPVHYHPLHPAAMVDLSDMHVAFSNLVFERAGSDHRLVPFSSSFVLAARKD